MRKFENVLIVTIILVTCICITVSSLLFLKSNANKENKEVEITLNGEENITIPIESEYIDEGIKITIDGEDIASENVDYTTTSDVDVYKTGEYEINYSVSYEEKEYNISRKVNVVDDTSPVIYIFNTSVSIKGEKNNLRYFAIDNYDGDLTDKVEVTTDGVNYTLRVEDSSKNVTIETISISSKLDNTVMELNGTHIEYVPVNESYEDKGVSVTNLDGKELNISYNIESNVDTSVVGEYYIKYTSDEISAYQVRKVIVYDKTSTNVNSCNEEKVIYLTFDDGPGQYTEELLEILDKYNIKATFFVTGQFKKYLYLIKEESEKGHTVGVHTMSHEWKVYRSFENYYQDFKEINDIIENETGKKATIFRFPGGSSNTISRGKSVGIMGYATNKMTELGYTYYDWNVDSEDAAGASSKEIYKNVTKGIENRNCSVVLMHDIKKNTISTIEEIIKYALDNGYTFKTLSNDSPTVHHHVNN